MTRGPALAAAWLLTRLAALGMLFGYEGGRGVAGDLTYFSSSLAAVRDTGLAHTLVEYPLPAVGVLAVPWGLGRLVGSPGAFVLPLLLCALLTDAAFTAYLARRTGTGGGRAIPFWLLAVPLLGGLALSRFDLLVGVLVAITVSLAQRRPRVAALLLAVATGIKLWPVLVLPALASRQQRGRGQLVAVFAGAGVFLATACVALAGWQRLVSPLLYQGGRGLQIESVAAGPAMVGRLVDPSRWPAGLSRFRAVEVTGPGVSALLDLSTLFSIVLVGWLVLVSWRACRRSASMTAEGLQWLALAAISGYMATDKVFSPQYLLWLLPLTACGLLTVPSAATRRWATALLALTALSHLVYPVLYAGLVQPGATVVPATTVLVLRDLLVVALALAAARQAWRHTAPCAPVSATPAPSQRHHDVS